MDGRSISEVVCSAAARSLLALTAAAILLVGCSSTPDHSAWCEAYREVVESLVEYDLAVPGSTESADAYRRVENGFAMIYAAEAPTEIAADYETVLAGPNPADGGDEWAATTDRVVGWAIGHCDYPRDFIELLQSE